MLDQTGESDGEGAAEAHSILGRLTADDEVVRQQALVDLYDGLARFVRVRTHHVAVVPESIVASVIFSRLPKKELREFANDAALWSWLMTVATNRLRDAIRSHARRARISRQLPMDSSGRQLEPASTGDGPSAECSEFEEQMIAASESHILGEMARFMHFHDRCMSAPISQTQRRFIELLLFEDKAVDDIAAHCETTVATVKTRLSQARTTIREHLLAPMRETVDARQWSIIEATCISRQRSETVATSLGIARSLVRGVIRESVSPWLIENYGHRGTNLFSTRLLGNHRRE